MWDLRKDLNNDENRGGGGVHNKGPQEFFHVVQEFFTCSAHINFKVFFGWVEQARNLLGFNFNLKLGKNSCARKIFRGHRKQ
jgi:hypothetical protein